MLPLSADSQVGEVTAAQAEVFCSPGVAVGKTSTDRAAENAALQTLREFGRPLDLAEPLECAAFPRFRSEIIVNLHPVEFEAVNRFDLSC
jgi:hypothetical protein